MDQVATLNCQRCGAPVPVEDLGMGLAVRINGEAVCQQCIEVMPAAIVASINRIRSSRGLAVTTYRLADARLPGTKLFSFSSATLINQHRRALHGGDAFPTPDYATRQQESAAARQASDHLRPRAAPAPGLRLPLIVGIAVAGLVLVIVVIAMLRSPSAPQSVAQQTPVKVPARSAPTRSDYASDPQAAFARAVSDAACPQNVLAAITDEVHRTVLVRLADAGHALDQQRLREADDLLANQAGIPADARFRELIALYDDLRVRLAAAKAAAPPPAQPNPIVVPAPPTQPSDAPVVVAPPTLPPPTLPPPTLPVPVMPPVAVTPPILPPPTLPLVTPPVAPMPPTLPPSPVVPPPVVALPQPATPATTTRVRPPPPPRAKELTPWDGVVKEPASLQPLRPLSLDGTVFIPTAWPPGYTEFHRSTLPPGQRHALVAEFKQWAIMDGGIVLLVQRGHPARRRLAVTVERDQSALTPIDLPDTDAWAPVTIATGKPSHKHFAIRFSDVDAFPIDRGFFIGGAIEVRDRLPMVADLGLDPVPLAMPDVVADADFRRRLLLVLNPIIQKRASQRAAFDPLKVKILTAPGIDAAWMTELRAALASTLGHPIADSDLGSLNFAADWWQNAQLQAATPLATAKDTTLLLLITNGAETADLAAAGRWLDAIARSNGTDVKRGGMIPVLVMGRVAGDLESDAAARATAIRMAWTAQLAKPNLPIIDLTTARGTTTRALAAGLRNLVQQMHCMGANLNWK